MTTLKIKNCKSASIKRCPWITQAKDQIIGELKAGQEISVDTAKVYYDWTGVSYYRCSTQYGPGFVAVGLVT